MSNPINPNYNPKSGGRLVVDRYEYQNHIDGYNFNHKANAIKLFPELDIRTVSATNVQDAIELLAQLVDPPALDGATSTIRGIIKINGDIRGTADEIFVSGLQGKPISANTPTHNQVLTYDGYVGAWTPRGTSNNFVAGGDLEGTNTVQIVSNLTGRTDKVNIIATQLTWSNSATTPTLSQANGTGSGKNLKILAQTSTSNGSKGGTLELYGGSPGTGGLLGGVNLGLDSGNSKLIQLKEVGASRRVLSLLSPNEISSIQMPNGTGDLVIYIADTSTPPTSGVPVDGVEVYSSGGKLFVKQSDGSNFAVGSIPNPSIWGTTTEQTYSSRSVVTTSTSVAQDAFSFNIPTLTSIRVDVIVVAKKIAATDSAHYNLSMGYTRHTGSPVSLGTVTSSDPRFSGNGSVWTAPSISLSGNTIKVKTGFSNTETVTWFVLTQLAINTTTT